MKYLIIILSLISVSAFIEAIADVYVNGYYRSDGTYVQPHYRSAPDSSKWNNYGSSKNKSELLNPRRRDQDNDGIPNYLDTDDNNNGIHDDQERKSAFKKYRNILGN